MAYIGSPAAPTVATVSDGTVTSAKLADDAVTSAKIVNNAVTSAKITDGAVTPSDLSTGHPNWDSSGVTSCFSGGSGTTGQLNLGYDLSAYWRIGRLDPAGTDSGNFQFKPDNGTSVLDITSSGNVTMQTSNSSGQPTFTLSNPDAQGTGTRINFNQGSSNYGYISSAYSGGWNIDVRANTSGGVRLAANGTSWGSLSDERAKDIIEPIDNALTKVNTLRTVIGKYKETDDDTVRRSFLIAQDVEAVLPEAVSIDDEDNYHLRYTEVIPLLTAAIKELKTLVDTQQQTIESLEARVATLESA